MSSLYRIRLARNDDAGEIAAIYRPFVEESVISFETEAPDAESIRERMAETEAFHAWLVCTHDDQVVGYAYSGRHRQRKGYDRVAEVSVYVHSDHRNRGIAGKLYRALHAIMKAQGYHKAYAIMTIPNEASRKFHLSFGYASLVVFKDAGYKLGRWCDTEWFTYTLNQALSDPAPLVPVQHLPEKLLEAILTGSG